MRTMKTHRSKNGPNPKKHKPKPRTPKVDVRKKAKTDPASPADQATASEAIGHIAAAERELTTAESEYEAAKVDAREAKARTEKLRKKLREIIAEEAGNNPTLYSTATVKAVAADDESWREEKIRDLELNEGTIAKLAEAHITTIGEYADYMKPQDNGFMPKLSDITGIGPKAVDAIQDAMEKFWAKQKERAALASKAVETVAESTAMPAAEALPSTNGDGHAAAETADEAGDE